MARIGDTVETDDDAAAESMDDTVNPVGPEDDGEDNRPPEADEEA